MNTKQRWFSAIIVALFWSSSALSQNQQLLTFQAAYEIMQKQNPALQKAKQEIIQKEYELKAKRGLYYPQVSLNAKAVAMSENLHLDLTPVGEAIAPLYETLGNYGTFSGVPNPDLATNTVMPILPDNLSTQAVREQLLLAGEEVTNTEWNQVIQEKEFISLTADFTWPILTGGKIKGANEAAAVQVDYSNENLRKTQGELLTELVSRYYGLALGLEVVEVKQQSFQLMEAHYKNASLLYENGMIAKVELLHAGVSRNEAERELNQAQRNVAIIRSGLAGTLLLDTQKILPASELFMNTELKDLPSWIDQALLKNPQLKQIENKKELIHIKNQVSKGSYWPSLALMGTYNLAEQNLSSYSPEWLVGAGMKWTVFNGMSRKNNLKVAASMKSQVNYAEEKAHVDLESYLTKLYQQLLMLKEQKEKLESTLEMATEYSSSTEKAFNEGLATSIAVVDAHTKVAQVKALRLKVLYDYDVTLAKLLQTVGSPEEFISYSTAY